MNDKELHQRCIDWIEWCRTRGYYLAPGAKNILARMQPSRSGTPPNARNDPDMQFFNMAIHAMADMSGHKELFVCFSLYYIEHAPDVKVEAERLEISRPTYYNRARSFARKAHSLSVSIKEVHKAKLMQVVDEVID